MHIFTDDIRASPIQYTHNFSVSGNIPTWSASIINAVITHRNVYLGHGCNIDCARLVALRHVSSRLVTSRHVTSRHVHSSDPIPALKLSISKSIASASLSVTDQGTKLQMRGTSIALMINPLKVHFLHCANVTLHGCSFTRVISYLGDDLSRSCMRTCTQIC